MVTRKAPAQPARKVKSSPSSKSKPTKQTKPTERRRPEPRPVDPIKQKERSQIKRYASGLLVLAMAIYLLVSVIYYYTYWFADQDILENCSLFDAISGALNGVPLANPCGPIGAMIGYYMVSIFFGVGAIAIPISLILWSLKIFGIKWEIVRKAARLITVTMLIMILLSVSLGFAFSTNWDMFGSGMGGQWGIYAGELLGGIVGSVGASIILIFLWLVAIIYTNVNIINIVGRGIARCWNFLVEPSPKRNRRPQRPRGQNRDLAPYPFKEDDQDPIIPIPDFVEQEELLEQKEAETETEAEAEAAEIKQEESADQEAQTPDQESENAEPKEQENTDNQDLEIEGLEIINTSDITVEKDAEPTVEPTTEPTVEAIEPKPIADESPVEVPLGSDVNLDQGLTINATLNEAVLEDKDIEDSLYDPTRELSDYQRPPVELLEDHRNDVTVTAEEIIANKDKIKQTLESFGIKIDHTKATVGPTVTLYEIVPSAGVRISKIKNLEDDIALNLSALGIRIIAPIPGKGTIGIEVPNKDKKIVSMYSVVKSVKFQESKFDIPIVLGKTIQNETFVIDLAKMPHLLVAGATGQGKSVGLNAIITSILYTKHPSELKLVLVDPKKVELTPYAKLEKHFMAKMPDEQETIITDNQRVIQTLKSLCVEMDTRYNLLNTAEVRNIKDYNNKFIHRRLNPNNGHKFLPYIVVVIDEFADLIMTAGREIEIPIARLAQLGRAAGMHIIIATQRPTTNIITGMIKANFPARIAFRVTSMIDSRTILDQPGANQLIGRGDMLVSTGSDIIRVQCAFADTPEVERITEFISNQRGYPTAYELPEIESEGGEESEGKKNEAPTDPMFKNIAYFVVQNNAGSTSAIQRRFAIGYNRAGRITDQLESAGIVGRAEGSKPREVLIKDTMSLDAVLNGLGIK